MDINPHVMTVAGVHLSLQQWNVLIRAAQLLMDREKQDGRDVEGLNLQLQFVPANNEKRVPQIGDRVHYILPTESKNGGMHRSAFVAAVSTDKDEPDWVRLFVLKGHEDDFRRKGDEVDSEIREFCGRADKSSGLTCFVTYSSEFRPGTWYYPRGG